MLQNFMESLLKDINCVLIVWLMTTFWANHNNYMNLVIIYCIIMRVYPFPYCRIYATVNLLISNVRTVGEIAICS